MVLANLGNLLGDRGASEEAIEVIDGALPLLAAAGDAAFAGHAHLYRGLAQLRAGRVEHGRTDLERARAHHRDARNRRFEALDHGYLGIAALLAGDVHAARSALARTDAELAAIGDAHMRIVFAAFAAVAAHRAGDPAAVEAAWQVAMGEAPAWAAAARARLAAAIGRAAEPIDDDTMHAALASAVAAKT